MTNTITTRLHQIKHLHQLHNADIAGTLQVTKHTVDNWTSGRVAMPPGYLQLLELLVVGLGPAPDVAIEADKQNQSSPLE